MERGNGVLIKFITDESHAMPLPSRVLTPLFSPSLLHRINSLGALSVAIIAVANMGSSYSLTERPVNEKSARGKLDAVRASNDRDMESAITDSRM